MTIIGDDAKTPNFYPAGWMGDVKAIRMDPNSTDTPHSGKSCTKVEFAKNDGWGGVVWQNPGGDWGDQSGGFNLGGARKLTWWARGKAGGEKVKFSFGIIGRDKRFYDTAKGELAVELSRQWRQYSIDLKDKDLHRIKTGFIWVVGGQGTPLTFYLDDVRYE